MGCQNFWFVSLGGHLTIGLPNALCAWHIILAKVFEGGPLLRRWTGAILKELITEVLFLIFTRAFFDRLPEFL